MTGLELEILTTRWQCIMFGESFLSNADWKKTPLDYFVMSSSSPLTFHDSASKQLNTH